MATSGFGGFAKGFAQGLDRQLQQKADLKRQQDQDVFRAKLGDYFSQRDAERKKFGAQQGIINAVRASGIDPSIEGEVVKAVVDGGMSVDDAITLFQDTVAEDGQQPNLPYTPVSEEPDLSSVLGESTQDRGGLFDSIPKFFGGTNPISEKVAKASKISGSDPKTVNGHVTGATSNNDQPYVNNRKFSTKTLTQEETIKRAIANSTTKEKGEAQVAMLVAKGDFDTAQKVTDALNWKEDSSLPRKYHGTDKKKGWIISPDGHEARVVYNEFGYQVQRKVDGKTTFSQVYTMGMMPDDASIVSDEKGNLSFDERRKVAEDIGPLFKNASRAAETIGLTSELKKSARGFSAQSQGTLVGAGVRGVKRVGHEIELLKQVGAELQNTGFFDSGTTKTLDEINASKSATLSKLGKLFSASKDITNEEKLVALNTAKLAYHLLEIESQTGHAVSTKEFALFQSALVGGNMDQLITVADSIEESVLKEYKNTQLDIMDTMRHSDTEKYNSLDLSEDPLLILARRLPPEQREMIREKYFSSGEGDLSPEEKPKTITMKDGTIMVLDDATGEYSPQE